MDSGNDFQTSAKKQKNHVTEMSKGSIQISDDVQILNKNGEASCNGSPKSSIDIALIKKYESDLASLYFKKYGPLHNQIPRLNRDIKSANPVIQSNIFSQKKNEVTKNADVNKGTKSLCRISGESPSNFIQQNVNRFVSHNDKTCANKFTKHNANKNKHNFESENGNNFTTQEGSHNKQLLKNNESGVKKLNEKARHLNKNFENSSKRARSLSPVTKYSKNYEFVQEYSTLFQNYQKN